METFLYQFYPLNKINTTKPYLVFQSIVIYPIESAIQLLNNWDQTLSGLSSSACVVIVTKLQWSYHSHSSAIDEFGNWCLEGWEGAWANLDLAGRYAWQPRAWEAPLNAVTDWHRYTERGSVEHTHLTPGIGTEIRKDSLNAGGQKHPQRSAKSHLASNEPLRPYADPRNLRSRQLACEGWTLPKLHLES